MSKLIMVTSLILLITGCSVKEEHPIVGDWRLIESSFALSSLCSEATISYTSDGHLLSTNGNLKEKKSYTVTPYKNGYLVETRHISDNNMENCQGLPASLSRKYPVNKIYLEVVNDGRNLKMHYHPEKDKGYLIVEKV